MARDKIALIGGSGSGKSAGVARSGGDLGVADMDRHFSPRVSAPYKEALDWMLDRTGGQYVPAVSAHVRMLNEFAGARRRGLHPGRLDSILFVHLYDGDSARRRQFLTLADGSGEMRPARGMGPCRENYVLVADACRDLADLTIHIANLSLDGVTSLVRALRDTAAAATA